MSDKRVALEPLLADPEGGSLEDLVDLDSYPVHCPGDPKWIQMIETVRDNLDTEGCATLPNFLNPEALAMIADELAFAAQRIPIRQHQASVYHRPELEAGCTDDDPRTTKLSWFAGHVTRDMIPAFSPAHRLYVSAAFKAFVAAAVGVARVYEYADPIAGLVATILPPTGRYPWHYDTNEFVLTIMIQPPEDGGLFQYCKNLRTPGDENFSGLSEVLEGRADERIRSVRMGPGDLQLFLGRYSLHQVTEVMGADPRHVLVLSYADRPGVIAPADRTRSIYGRVTEAHLLADQNRLASADGLIL